MFSDLSFQPLLYFSCCARWNCHFLCLTLTYIVGQAVFSWQVQRLLQAPGMSFGLLWLWPCHWDLYGFVFHCPSCVFCVLFWLEKQEFSGVNTVPIWFSTNQCSNLLHLVVYDLPMSWWLDCVLHSQGLLFAPEWTFHDSWPGFCCHTWSLWHCVLCLKSCFGHWSGNFMWVSDKIRYDQSSIERVVGLPSLQNRYKPIRAHTKMIHWARFVQGAATAKPIGAHPTLECPFAMYQICPNFVCNSNVPTGSIAFSRFQTVLWGTRILLHVFFASACDWQMLIQVTLAEHGWICHVTWPTALYAFPCCNAAMEG